jgi:hypothetical protein
MEECMKSFLKTASVIAVIAGFSAPALAAHEIAADLRSRAEISTFYNALVTTGVINELQPGKTYTIIAPTNAAFDKLTPEKYPCLYSEQCHKEIADVLRNHIVPEEITFVGPTRGAVFSIDDMNLNLARDNMAKHNDPISNIAGHKIVKRGPVKGGFLVEIDGVVASPSELAMLTRLKMLPVAATPPSTVQETTTKQIHYEPDGTPSGVTETTTYKTVTPAP